ncbi:DNA primase family protein [Nitrospira sp. Nam74]
MDEQAERLKGLADAFADRELKSDWKILKTTASTNDKRAKRFLAADAADQYLKLRGLRREGLLLLRYYRRGWYRYDGTIYVQRDADDIKADVMRYLRQVDKKLATPAFQAGVIANLHAICEMPTLIDLPAMRIERGWETRPDLIVVQNGIVDIKSPLRGVSERLIVPHTPSFVSTVLLPFAYDPSAVCPRWESFIASVLPDPECQWLIQEMFGYCLTFDTSQQKFFLLFGEGANGKGVILRVLRMLLGLENVSSVPLSRLGERFDLALTLGKLVNLASEVDNVRQLDEAVIKQFTGEDPMRMENKYEKPFTAMPTAKLIIAANSTLPFKDRSEGIWRRLIAIPFPVTIPEAEQNKNLTVELAEEMSGILNWSIAGQARLREQGRFTQPKVSQDAACEFRRQANSARLFLEEYCTATTGVYVNKGELYQSYCTFCKQERHEPLKSHEFSKEVLKHFPSVTDKARPRVGEARLTCYGGLSLHPNAPSPFL